MFSKVMATGGAAGQLTGGRQRCAKANRVAISDEYYQHARKREAEEFRASRPKRPASPGRTDCPKGFHRGFAVFIF